MTRTRTQVRIDRLNVMSAALDLFKTRKMNAARRNKWQAEDMRFAGPEAEFCIAEVKSRFAMMRLEAAVAKSRADQLAAMTDEQREARIRSILDELRLLPYASFAVNAVKEGAALRAELAELQAVERWTRPVSDPAKLDVIRIAQAVA